MKSQIELIANWLARGRPITPIQALSKFGCFRLGARIWELKQIGWDIKTRIVNQNGKHFAEYRI